jgi:membrane protease YdiL (CAAX protease family)
MTIRKHAVACVIAGLCSLAAPAFAATRVEQADKAVDAAMDSAYAQALADFDRAIASNPGDAALAVSRCEFIGQFTDSEGGRYLERAETDLDACNQKLEALAKAPEVQVYDFANDWDDDAMARGDALLAGASHWPLPLRRKLAADLASRYRYKPHVDQHGKQVIIQAAELGDGASIGEAVAALVEAGEATRAQALLDRAPAAESDWTANERVRAALKLPDTRAARNELFRQQKAGRGVAPSVAALAQLRAGDVRAAKAALGDARGNSEEQLDARFGVAMAMRDYPTAATAIRMQDWDNLAENTGRFLALAAASPPSLLRPAMWASLFVLLACVALYLLMPAVLLVPVHYRGLARRLAHRAPPPLFESVRLRHAWMAIVAFLLVPMCVLAVVDPAHFGDVFANGANPDPKRMLLTTSLTDALCLALFAPIVLRLARAGQFRPATALRAWKQVLLAVAICWAVGALLGVVHRWMGTDTMTDQVRMVNDLINRHDTRWDGILALLSVALLVPIWEEFSFRGMVLGGMSRHIGFAWANFWQALLFALCHNDWPRFPYYLTMGLLAGWLVRRTGRLAPAILLHMIINATAFFLLRH